MTTDHPFGAALRTAGGTIGFSAADFSEAAARWRMAPLGANKTPPAWEVSHCIAGTWQQRRASATVQIRVGGRAMNGQLREVPHWVKAELVITSVGFISGVVPLIAAAPTAPLTLPTLNPGDKADVLHWWDWMPVPSPNSDWGKQLSVPGDTDQRWRVMSQQTVRPGAILADLAGVLHSEPAYPWRTDGGKKGFVGVDLVRVDVSVPGTGHPPTAELLAARFDQLSAMAASIEATLTRYPATLRD
ncbi:MAG TPA: hypothetical protein VHX38_07035 [Pseudonocardiaceae bacterium]|nr:hypothetical protein [Pseudonocardiaceae bacterium]